MTEPVASLTPTEIEDYAPAPGSSARQAWDCLSGYQKRLAVAWRRGETGAVDLIHTDTARREILTALGYGGREIVGTAEGNANPDPRLGLRCGHCGDFAALSFYEGVDEHDARAWRAACRRCLDRFAEARTAYPLRCDRCGRYVPVHRTDDGAGRLCSD